jgi:hypothetical protein
MRVQQQAVRCHLQANPGTAAACIITGHLRLPSCQKNMMPYPGQLIMALGKAGGPVVMISVSTLDLKEGPEAVRTQALRTLL